MNDSFVRRTIAGAAFVLLVVGMAYAGGVAFLFFALAVTVAGTLEFYRLAAEWGASPYRATGAALGAALVLSAFLWGPAGMGAAAAVSAGLAMIVPVVARSDRAAESGAVTAVGVLYVAFLASFMTILREWPGREGSERLIGFSAVMGAFAATWGCDTAAYVFGSAFGRHKLLPSVSPRKTWEGAVAGLLGAVGGLALVMWALGRSMGPVEVIGVGLAMGVAAQLGDLIESKMKRLAGVKDASGLIPGHGGVLDRFDGFLLAAPVFYLYLVSGGLASPG